jgi:hypothetical protein
MVLGAIAVEVWPRRAAGKATSERKGTQMTLASPETKFGIKIQSRKWPRTIEQSFSLVAGLAYLVGGIAGFWVTGLSPVTGMTNHAMFGIFMLNPYHNIVHIAVGLLWLLGAFALTAAGNEGLNLAIGAVYALATALGFLGYLHLLAIGTTGIAGIDNYLHLVTAVATLIFGTGLLRMLPGRRVAATA